MIMRPFHRTNTNSALLLAVAIALPATAGADDSGFPALSFSGYGTLGATHSSETRADYLIDPTKPNGPGHTRRPSFDVDTKLGMQASAQLGHNLSAVLQLVSQQNHDGSYAPSVEWANVKYQATQDISLRAGRIVLPIFMATDSRKVGYANLWVRPPVEVYGMVPLATNDGLDATFRLLRNDVTGTFHVTYGKARTQFPASGNAAAAPGTAKADQLVAVVGTLEKGFATARVSYGRTQLTLKGLEPFFDALRQFGPQGNELSDKYGANDKRASFAGVGVTYDPGPWLVMGEWTNFKADTFTGARRAWYMTAAYRFNNWSPYATHSEVKSESERSNPGISLAGLPPPYAQAAAGLNAGLNRLLAGTAAQKTTSLGARWDVAKNVAIKLQWDEIRAAADSAGTYGNFQPGFAPGGKTRVVSTVVDFVF
jgi:hypothetical protein